MDPAEAAQMGEAVAEKLLQYRRDASGWKNCWQKNGVSVSWRPSVEFPGHLYRGEAVLSAPTAKVWDHIRPHEGGLRQQWDENVTGLEIIQTISDTLIVSRTTTPSAAMKLISPRDFVDLVLLRTYEDGTLSSNAIHVEHPSCPPQPGYVRGFNYPCGCICEPLPEDPSRTKLVTFFQTDLSGLLPRGVVDSFFPRSMASSYANLERALQD